VRKGLSLIEMIIAVGLSALVIYLGATLLSGANKQVKNSGEKFTSRTLLAVLSGSLQKFMASGDLRFLAFSGRPLNDRPVARAVLPLPEKCSDPSGTADPQCARDVGVVYVHYDKLTTPTVTVICNFVEPTSANGFKGKWLVDLNNETYGPPTAVTDGFNISGAADAPFTRGLVTVKLNQMLVLMNPPISTLWVATSAPTKLNVTVLTPAPALTTSPDLTGDCLKNLQASQDVTKLYTIDYVPLILTQFTGGTSANINPATLISTQGSYPLRIFASEFRSVGKRKISNEYELALSSCSVSTNSPTLPLTSSITCTGKVIASIPNVTSIKLEEIFTLKLKNSVAERFELKTAAQTLSPSCAAPICKALPITLGSIPVLTPRTTNTSTTMESFETLDPTDFSLIKQEALARLRFKLVNTNGKEDSFDIVFP